MSNDKERHFTIPTDAAPDPQSQAPEASAEAVPDENLAVATPTAAQEEIPAAIAPNSANKGIFDLCKATFDNYKAPDPLHSPRTDEVGKAVRLHKRLKDLANGLQSIPYQLGGGGKTVVNGLNSTTLPSSIASIVELFNKVAYKNYHNLDKLIELRNEMVNIGAIASEAPIASQGSFFQKKRDPGTQAVYEALHAVSPLIEKEKDTDPEIEMADAFILEDISTMSKKS